MKWITFLLIPTVLGTGLLCFDSGPTGRASHEDAPRARIGARVPRRQVFAAGVVEGTQRETELNFETAGRITELRVVEGQHVSANDVLARLDSALQEHKLREAEAELDLARAAKTRLSNGARAETRRVSHVQIRLAEIRFAQADRDLKRTQVLAQKRVVPADRLDDAQSARDLALAELERARAQTAEIEAPARPDELAMADARVHLAEAAVLQAREMLKKTILRSPIDAVVLSVAAEPGELVVPQRTEPLIVLTNTGQPHVRAYVEELDALNLKIGQRGWVTADGRPGERFDGTLVWLSPRMSPKKVRHQRPTEHIDVKVREVLLRLEKSQGLVLGTPVDVYIVPLDDQRPNGKATTPPEKRRNGHNPPQTRETWEKRNAHPTLP